MVPFLVAMLYHRLMPWSTFISCFPVNGCLNFQGLIKTEQPIGFDKNGQPTDYITILTDGGGKSITAFPGLCMQASRTSNDQIIFPQAHQWINNWNLRFHYFNITYGEKPSDPFGGGVGSSHLRILELDTPTQSPVKGMDKAYGVYEKDILAVFGCACIPHKRHIKNYLCFNGPIIIQHLPLASIVILWFHFPFLLNNLFLCQGITNRIQPGWWLYCSFVWSISLCWNQLMYQAAKVIGFYWLPCLYFLLPFII